MKSKMSKWASSSMSGDGLAMSVIVNGSVNHGSVAPDPDLAKQPKDKTQNILATPMEHTPHFKKSTQVDKTKGFKVKHTKKESIEWNWTSDDKNDGKPITRVTRPIFMPSYLSRNSVRSSLPRNEGSQNWYAAPSSVGSHYAGSYRTSDIQGSYNQKVHFGGKVSFAQMSPDTMY